ncbi:glycosyltransferase [Pseudohongiella nitratireducens]|uniref:glycosyltransferase n=1 Tax=Pseudohongiella nitratireducens TaxID=1768907 RepID=UPI0030EE9782
MLRRLLHLLFWLNLTVIVSLVIYKVYLNFFETDYRAEHARQLEQLESDITEQDQYRFAVVGNISNSVGIFERKIIPRLNAEGYDFVISAGNAVSTGGEDKYRAIYRTLSRLQMPYLLTFGPKEESRLGSFRFYDHFGPLHYSFATADSRFIFIDSTGTTDFDWQLRWLNQELSNATEQNQFLFSANPLHPVAEPSFFGMDGDYLFPTSHRMRFIEMVGNAGVDAVFSTDQPFFERQRHSNTDYIVTGGAGGFVFNNEDNHYHFVSVAVNGGQITIEEQQLDVGQHPFWRTAESLWFFIHSLFYVGYLNFIILISFFAAVGIWLHTKVFTERDYYPDFDVTADYQRDTPLKVAMFTNNYLPYIGGVPISVDRLRRGLIHEGHQVKVVAPHYQHEDDSDQDVCRVSSLLPLPGTKEFKVANIFTPRIWREVKQFAPDIIHVHHPFWLGWVGQLLGRMLRVPVIYTYHTRLEHYAHYVPLPGPLFRNVVAHTMIRRFANRCNAVIVPTSSAEEYLRTIGVRRPVLVQPTGIEYQRFSEAIPTSELQSMREQLGLSADKRVLVSISRLSKEKNIVFMFQAMKELRDRGSDFHLLVIGDGPDRRLLEDKIQELGLEEHITLVGSVPPHQMARYCQLGDIFVFTSRSETQGMVILEAMAAGLPVVAIRSSGIEDIVRHNYNGFKTASQMSQWVERVAMLIDDEALRTQLAGQAQSFASEYGIAPFTSSVVGLYDNVLASQRRNK